MTRKWQHKEEKKVVTQGEENSSVKEEKRSMLQKDKNNMWIGEEST
jgi:hypothetical protein